MKKTILIIDNDISSIHTLINILRDDYIMRVAKTGIEGLDIAMCYPFPDIIILDIILSDIDGFIILNKLKNNPETQHIPIVIISSVRENLILNIPYNEFIQKPIKNKRLVKMRIKNVENRYTVKKIYDFSLYHNKSIYILNIYDQIKIFKNSGIETSIILVKSDTDIKEQIILDLKNLLFRDFDSVFEISKNSFGILLLKTDITGANIVKNRIFNGIKDLQNFKSIVLEINDTNLENFVNQALKKLD
ncbi:MAG: response regulator [Defluviitaleaceae bacterium]|nr:response regulator [Defluviitaleaceae bacterium]